MRIHSFLLTLFSLLFTSTVSHALPTNAVTRTATESYVTNRVALGVASAVAQAGTNTTSGLATKVSTNDTTYLTTVSKAGTAVQPAALAGYLPLAGGDMTGSIMYRHQYYDLSYGITGMRYYSPPFGVDVRLEIPIDVSGTFYFATREWVNGQLVAKVNTNDTRYLSAVTNNQNGVRLNTMAVNNGVENQYAQTLSYNPATRVMTITPTGTSFKVTSGGITQTFTSPQASSAAPLLPDQFFYYNTSGQFIGTNTAWTINGEAQVGYVLMNTNDNSVVLTVDERHGVNMSDEWHRQQHFTIGTKWSSGMALFHNAADSTTAANASGLNTCISIQNGIMYDEDVEHITVTNGVQAYASITTNTAGVFPVLYRNTSGDWVRTDGTQFPFLFSGNTPQVYSNGTLRAVAEDQYFVYWLVAVGGFRGTNLFLIPHPITFASTAAAQSGATPYSLGAILGTLPSQEILVTHRLVFLFNASAANSHPVSVKSAKLRDVTDFRSLSSGVIVAGMPGASSQIVHADTAGRDAADAHPISAITGLTDAIASAGGVPDVWTNMTWGAIGTNATYRMSWDVTNGTFKVEEILP